MSGEARLQTDFDSDLLQNLQQMSANLEYDLKAGNTSTFDFDDWLQNVDTTNSEPDPDVLEMLNQLERECIMETQGKHQNESTGACSNINLLQSTSMQDDEKNLDCLDKLTNDICMKAEKDKIDDFQLLENLLNYDSAPMQENPPFLEVENALLPDTSSVKKGTLYVPDWSALLDNKEDWFNHDFLNDIQDPNGLVKDTEEMPLLDNVDEKVCSLQTSPKDPTPDSDNYYKMCKLQTPDFSALLPDNEAESVQESMETSYTPNQQVGEQEIAREYQALPAHFSKS